MSKKKNDNAKQFRIKLRKLREQHPTAPRWLLNIAIATQGKYRRAAPTYDPSETNHQRHIRQRSERQERKWAEASK